MSLSTIAAEQAKATKRMLETSEQLLDYCATHPDAKIRFHASDMILQIHSDASYLIGPKGKSRAGGRFSLDDYLCWGNQSN